MFRILPLALLSTTAWATDITVPFTGKRPHTFDLHAGFAFYGVGGAVGGRYSIPIVDNGFIPSLDNSVNITFGADIYFTNYFYGDRPGRYYGVGVGVPVTLAWNFYFTDDWSAFGEAGVNVYLGNDLFRGYGLNPGSHWLVAAVGGRYHFNERMALIGRAGSPYTGIGIEFTL